MGSANEKYAAPTSLARFSPILRNAQILLPFLRFLLARPAGGPNKVVTSPLHAFPPSFHPRLTPRTASALYVFTPNVVLRAAISMDRCTYLEIVHCSSALTVLTDTEYVVLLAILLELGAAVAEPRKRRRA